MARKIRFPLKMKNDAEVRTLDELKENFDLESVLGYFADGKLTTWLADRYYDEKAAAVSALSADMPDLNAKLCEILEVEYQPENDTADLEYIQRRNEKLRIISVFTDDKDILNNIDLVALNQNDLFDILDEDPEKVYLYGKKFYIPFVKKNICYIGVNNPIILIDKSKYAFEYEEEGIVFRNVHYDESVNPYITRGELLYLENKYTEAFPLVEKAAENGNPRAMYIIAMMYKDNYNAIKYTREWLKKSYSYGEPLSTANYAYWCCKNEPEKKQSILNGIGNALKKLADNGDILAQFEYGDYLRSYSDDKKSGAEFIMNVALKGFAPAQNTFGSCYYNGHGVGQNYSKAVEWYRKAANQGNASAQDWMGFFYTEGKGIERDYVQAVEWFRKAAEQGYDDAQNKLGNCYYNGHGVGQDYSKAVEWYRKAAEQDYALAQNNLGNCYYNGHGVRQDYSKAVEWYRKAANQGNANAQDWMGFFYREGKGVEWSHVQAVEWFKKAAEQGYAPAQNNLGYMYQHGLVQDYSKAVEWYRKAANQGNACAQCNLGYMYENGYGVGQDYFKAVEWYKKAAANGNETAKHNLDNLGESI